MYYYVDGYQVHKEEFESSLRTATYNKCVDSLQQMLDTMYPDVEIEEALFKASVILKCCAPGKYNKMLNERVDFVMAGYLEQFEEPTVKVVDGVLFQTSREFLY